ncbi:hypothetical protein BJ165DRAFT_1354726 [Panaeolus papilionaceus]|nr:hypothetical protein BJ165DRAFT_1354726 [Panaeolus papilionaceus]
MSASNNTPALAERNDIHKSCRSIEALLTVLNEYCEAAGAIVVLQKKLAKALRETAGLRVTGEVAAHAMNLSANIFEALSEVDTKFAKLADREYDGISTEVKKWFKKLTKEEKAHDERMANANAKIKQAGQTYEKKSKKRAIDAGEEHARYINLISVLGPEMSQDKYNHHLSITQRHATTTHNVAASLARLADVEWQKSCECTRRFSPNVGPLGRYRVLCEGGWTGDIPSDLPNIDEQVRQYTNASYQSSTENLQQDPRINSRSQSSAGNSPVIPRHIPMPLNETFNANGSSASLARTPDELEPPRDHLFDPHTGSVRSLSAFPAPPTHLPPPPPFPRLLSQNANQTSSPLQPSSSNLEQPPAPTPQYISESPVSEREERLPADAPVNLTNPRAMPQEERIPAAQELPPPSDAELGFRAPRNIPEPQASHAPLEIMRPIPLRSETALSLVSSNSHNPDKQVYNEPQPSPVKSMTLTRYPRGEVREEEFGASNGATPKARTMDVASKYSRAVERTDTGTSTGSVVAALRNRYSLTSESTSPPPRELPKVPLSVNTLVSKYQGPTSPRLRAVSPPVSRQQSLPVLDNSVQQSRQAFHDRIASPTASRSPPLTADDDRRRQRLSESQERGRKAKEQELRQREMELDRRAQELDRERTRLHNLREIEERYDDVNGQGPGNAHEQYGRPQYSYSATHLVPPSNAMAGSSGRHHDDRSSINHSTNPSGSMHASYCGCETCSIQKYKSSSQATDDSQQRQRKDSKPEKTKSWIRRLSMPVGNAFGSSERTSAAEDGYLRGTPGPGSNANGKRGQETRGMGNRSVTNLGVSGRH